MKEAKGIGLAANQIGVSQAVCITDLEPGQEPKAYINPEITESSDPISFDEACLSIPGVSEKTTRFNKVKVKYQNRFGEYVEEQLEGIKAIAIQHEVDHLNGKLYIDQLSRLKKQLLAKQYQKRNR